MHKFINFYAGKDQRRIILTEEEIRSFQKCTKLAMPGCDLNDWRKRPCKPCMLLYPIYCENVKDSLCFECLKGAPHSCRKALAKSTPDTETILPDKSCGGSFSASNAFTIVKKEEAMESTLIEEAQRKFAATNYENVDGSFCLEDIRGTPHTSHTGASVDSLSAPHVPPIVKKEEDVEDKEATAIEENYSCRYEATVANVSLPCSYQTVAHLKVMIPECPALATEDHVIFEFQKIDDEEIPEIRDRRHWSVTWEMKLANLRSQMDKIEALETVEKEDGKDYKIQADVLETKWKDFEAICSRKVETLTEWDQQMIKEVHNRAALEVTTVRIMIEDRAKKTMETSTEKFIVEQQCPSTDWRDVQREMMEYMEQVVQRGPKQELMQKIERLVNKLNALPLHVIIPEKEILKERAQVKKLYETFQWKYLCSIDKSNEEEWPAMIRFHEKMTFKVREAQIICNKLDEKAQKKEPPDAGLQMKTEFPGNQASQQKEVKVQKMPWAPDARRKLRLYGTVPRKVPSWMKPKVNVKEISDEAFAKIHEEEIKREYCEMGPLCQKGVQCPHKHMHIDKIINMGIARRKDVHMGKEGAIPFSGKENIIFQAIRIVWHENVAYKARRKVNEEVDMLQLPDELLIQILLHMPPSSIGSLARASFDLSRIARDDYLWQRKCKLDYPGVEDVLEEEEEDNGWRTNPWKVPPQPKPPRDPPTWEEIYRSWYHAQMREKKM